MNATQKAERLYDITSSSTTGVLEITGVARVVESLEGPIDSTTAERLLQSASFIMTNSSVVEQEPERYAWVPVCYI